MQAEQIRGTLHNAGFTDAQVEGLTAVLADLASKDDFRNLQAEVHGEIRDLRSELHGEIRDLRSELHGEIRDLRTELHGEIRDLRGELHGHNGNLRAEFHQEISGMWRKLALTLFAQTMTIVLSVAAIQIALG